MISSESLDTVCWVLVLLLVTCVNLCRKKREIKKNTDPKGMISWMISLYPFSSWSGNPACVWSSQTGNKLLTLWLLLAVILQTSAFELKARPLWCIKTCTLALIVELPFRTKRLQQSCKGSLVSGPCSHDTLANLTLKWTANEDALHSLLCKYTLQGSNCNWSSCQLD